ncbi:MAG: outer membrane beta-barrel protein [Desulfocucumaceae bacterium]
MKKHAILLAALILTLAAGANAMTISGGAAWFNPTGVEGSGGVLFSLGAGQRVDQMVMANIQLDFMNKTFTKELSTTVDLDTGSVVTLSTREVAYKHSVKYFPVSAGVLITLPVDITYSIKPFIEGRVGYGFANVSYDYNETTYDIPEASRPEGGTYSGFGWRLATGIRMSLGSRSGLTLGAFYNGNTVSRSQDSNTFVDLEMSGLGLGAGLELSGF